MNSYIQRAEAHYGSPTLACAALGVSYSSWKLWKREPGKLGAREMPLYIQRSIEAHIERDGLRPEHTSAPWLPWVSVEEQLPPPGFFVFCVNRFGMHEAWFGHDNAWRLRGHVNVKIHEVSHWLLIRDIPMPDGLRG